VAVRFVASDRWEHATVRARTGITGPIGALTYVPSGKIRELAEGCAAVLLATPAEASLELAPGLVERGIRVIDLSGAFRLEEPSMYPHYDSSTPHSAAPLASTGLS
jgi:N-acetyl-gamma-glutamyl-phosphate reductase